MGHYWLPLFRLVCLPPPPMSPLYKPGPRTLHSYCSLGAFLQREKGSGYMAVLRLWPTVQRHSTFLVPDMNRRLRPLTLAGKRCERGASE